MVPEELKNAICRAAETPIIGARLGSEIDLLINTAKSSNSLTDAMASTRPRGPVVLLGVPNQVNINPLCRIVELGWSAHTAMALNIHRVTPTHLC